jgi:high-affinity iron transporter
MAPSVLIVFREVIEAGLIVGIVLAATRGVAGRTFWVGIGILGGVAGAGFVAAFAGELASLFQGSGQELFDATILLVAVAMLTWHVVWMSGHGRAIARDMKEAGARVSSGDRPMAARAIVVGVAVLREGSEVVLFLYGIASQGGISAWSMLAGGALGLAAGVATSALMYFGLLTIPARRIFSVTSSLIVLLAAGMAAQAIVFLQQGGYFEFLTRTLWNTSAILSQDSIGGRLLHTLVGYSDAPNGAQLLAYLATIIAIVGLMRLEQARQATRAIKPA